ncbi:MAG: hypothetical protein HY644_11290 [Acidobacteria bacterium]|nr:hypothetical protein [Acidobacteriota bacterium]
MRYAKWFPMTPLVLLLLMSCPLHPANLVYGIGNDHGRATTNPKISKEVQRQVKARDGYSPNDKKVVVALVVPPELGGVADFNNLRAFSRREARQRDKVKKAVLKKVRKGEMSVGEARARIVFFQVAGAH